MLYEQTNVSFAWTFMLTSVQIYCFTVVEIINGAVAKKKHKTVWDDVISAG